MVSTPLATDPSDPFDKEPFEIDLALAAIRPAIAPYPKAAMFALAELGYNTPFQQLISCIISIRTYDEVSLPVSRQLFEQASTPAEILQQTPDAIAHLIQDSTFAEAKAQQIWDIAQRVCSEFGGDLPCDYDVMTSFKGVGPKCANLSLGIACQQPRISVDVHVHRVTNRWGYVATKTPEKTLKTLESKLPERHRVAINELLVPFGKHICTGDRPHCSTCPVESMCQQVGVVRSR